MANDENTKALRKMLSAPAMSAAALTALAETSKGPFLAVAFVDALKARAELDALVERISELEVWVKQADARGDYALRRAHLAEEERDALLGRLGGEV